MICENCGMENIGDAQFCQECGKYFDKNSKFDVFISYSKKDKNIADAITAKLEGRKIKCWIAPRDINPGNDWGASIVDAIHNSRIMVLIFSSESNNSPQVLREVERAVNNGIPIIPFRIDNIIPSKSLEYFISATHWLDALTPPLEKHIGKLSQIIADIMKVDENGSNVKLNSYRRNLVEDDEWNLSFNVSKYVPSRFSSTLRVIFRISFITFIILYGGLFFLVGLVMSVDINHYILYGFFGILTLITSILLILEGLFAKSTNNYLKKWINLKPYRNIIIVVLVISVIILLVIGFSFPHPKS